MKIDIAVETALSQSVRSAQVSSMFDVPSAAKARLEWHGELPLDEKPWHVGLIVGPSGSGKSTILRETFGREIEFAWTAPSVIDDFASQFGVQDVSTICMATGFSTIPAWLRPYAVLSTGEKFRVDLARRLLEGGDLVVCDEFSSVVDRQVAQIGAHAVQKYIRKAGRQFVAASCHYDIVDWLQPDWMLEPATMTFQWRSVQRRPDIHCAIERAPFESWQTFAKFHYLTAELHRAARTYVLSVDGRPAAFCAALYRPHPRADDIYGLSRGVVLPDFQGCGLIFALIDRIGAIFKRKGFRARSYPAHPGYIRSHDRSPVWKLISLPGANLGKTSKQSATSSLPKFGNRPNAVFEYCGPMASVEDANLIFGTGQMPL